MAHYPDSADVSPTDLLQLPRTDEAWELLQTSGPAFRNDEGRSMTSHVALLVSDDTFVQRLLASEKQLAPAELARLVADACAWPEEGPSRRPGMIMVSEPVLAAALERALAGSGMRVRAGELILAEQAYSHMMRTLVPPPPPDYLALQPEATLRAYFRSAKLFYRARPWEAFAGEKFLAFRLEGGAWHYANVMGQDGVEFGLATFSDWLTVCRFTNTAARSFYRSRFEPENEQLPEAFIAAGEAESLQLEELSAASDGDASLVDMLRIAPVSRGLYPLVRRFTPKGERTPRFSPAVYSGLLQVTAERAARARSGKVSSVKASVRTDDGILEVRYPARGDENEARSDYYRIGFPFRIGALSPEPGGITWVMAEVPGEAKWHRVADAVRRAAEGIPGLLPWVHALTEADSGHLLWLDRSPVKEPSPTVSQLAGLHGVLAELSHEQVPLRFMPLVRPAAAEIRVFVLEQEMQEEAA
jgi:hypothetical protein